MLTLSSVNHNFRALYSQNTDLSAKTEGVYKRIHPFFLAASFVRDAYDLHNGEVSCEFYRRMLEVAGETYILPKDLSISRLSKTLDYHQAAIGFADYCEATSIQIQLSPERILEEDVQPICDLWEDLEKGGRASFMTVYYTFAISRKIRVHRVFQTDYGQRYSDDPTCICGLDRDVGEDNMGLFAADRTYQLERKPDNEDWDTTLVKLVYSVIGYILEESDAKPPVPEDEWTDCLYGILEEKGYDCGKAWQYVWGIFTSDREAREKAIQELYYYLYEC